MTLVMRRTFARVFVIVVVPVAIVVAGFLGFRSWRESIPEAYRLCTPCGFTREQVDTLVFDAHRFGVTAADRRTMFEADYGQTGRACWTACAAALIAPVDR